MGTRARIAYRYSDGSCISSYHHWDGYLQGLGSLLTKSYTDPKLIEKCIHKGNASVWRKDSELNEYYDNEPCTVHKDTNNLLETAFDSCVEYLYVYSEKLKTWRFCISTAGEFVSINKDSFLEE